MESQKRLSYRREVVKVVVLNESGFKCFIRFWWALQYVLKVKAIEIDLQGILLKKPLEVFG